MSYGLVCRQDYHIRKHVLAADLMRHSFTVTSVLTSCARMCVVDTEVDAFMAAHVCELSLPSD